MLDYISRGYYALQLVMLLTLYPRNQMMAIDSNELFTDTNAVCQRVFAFLGVESFPVEITKVYNRGYYREQMTP
jgi:hypothetical protein